MRGLALIVLLVALAACTRNVESRPQAERPVAPIGALQVRDLLSPNVNGEDGNLFVSVDPEKCSGVAREVDPPFIVGGDPAATDGGHWTVEGQYVVVEEMAGVYHADFDARGAVAAAQRTIDSCRDTSFTVATMRGTGYAFRLLPQTDSGSPDIVLWSFSAVDWACDNAFVAAHNAAIGIATCGPVNGYDVRSLAQDALKRIETLANTTA